MHNATVMRLILKDFAIFRKEIIFYTSAGLISILLLNIPAKNIGYIGSIILCTAMVAMYCHIALINVVHETTTKQSLFVMTLPVTIRAYNVSKVISSVFMYLSVWALILATTLLSLQVTGFFPSAYLSFFTVIFGMFIPGFMFVLAVALTTRSERWTIIALVFSNMAQTTLIYIVQHHPIYKEAFGLGSIKDIGFIWPSITNRIITIECIITAIICTFIVFAIKYKREFI